MSDVSFALSQTLPLDVEAVSRRAACNEKTLKVLCLLVATLVILVLCTSKAHRQHLSIRRLFALPAKRAISTPVESRSVEPSMEQHPSHGNPFLGSASSVAGGEQQSMEYLPTPGSAAEIPTPLRPSRSIVELIHAPWYSWRVAETHAPSKRETQVPEDLLYDPYIPNEHKADKRALRVAIEKVEFEKAMRKEKKIIEAAEAQGKLVSQIAVSAPDVPEQGPEQKLQNDPKKDYAKRILKKMGWKEGEGLGKDGQGMATPLVVHQVPSVASDADRMWATEASLARPSLGIIMEGERLVNPEQDSRVNPEQNSGAPSRVMVLHNLISRGQVHEYFEDEIVEEVSKYGKVVQCIVMEFPHLPDDQAVHIFLEFDKVEDATKCLTDMKGRYYAKRMIEAKFYDESRWNAQDLIADSGRLVDNGGSASGAGVGANRLSLDHWASGVSNYAQHPLRGKAQDVTQELPPWLQPQAQDVTQELGVQAAGRMEQVDGGKWDKPD